MWRMSAGREFQTDGPATENARSPNLVTVGGTVYENVSETIQGNIFAVFFAAEFTRTPESITWKSGEGASGDGSLCSL